MAVLTDFLTEIANKLRYNLSITATINASQFSTKIDEVYNKATSDFWDMFQNFGAKSDYTGAFAYWKSTEQLNPKYTIYPPAAEVDKMFKNFDAPSINTSKFDLSRATMAYQTFYAYKQSFVPYLNLKSKGYASTYAGSTFIETIEKFDVSNVTSSYSSVFVGCSNLKNIVVEGIIGQSGLSFQDCPLLTYDSLNSIIAALERTTPGTTRTITFNLANKTTYDNNHGVGQWDAMVAVFFRLGLDYFINLKEDLL